MKRLQRSDWLAAHLGGMADDGDGQRLTRLLHGCQSVIYASRPDGDYGALFVSPNVERLLGWTVQDFLGDPGFWLRNVHPDDLAAVHEALERLQSAGAVAYEYRFRRRDGEWRWIRDEVTVWRDDDGTAIELTGAMTDVTERVRETDERLLNEERLRLALAAANAGTFTWDIRTDEDVWSPEQYALYGIAEADAPSRFERWISAVHPEDRDWVRADIHALVEGRIPEFRHEYRIVHPEKGIRWVAGWGRMFQGEDGLPARVSGINMDVTERKELERQASRAAELRQKLIDALPNPVYFRDPQGRYVFVNKALQDAVGAGAEHILGRTNHDLLRSDYAEAIDRSDRALMETGGTQTLEVRMALDGVHDRDFLVHKTLFRDAAGAVEGVIGSLVDLTELKRTEERLLQAAKLATLGQIASEVAHEINQPLSILRMTVEWLIEDLKGSEHHDKLDQIERQIARMARIVGQLGIYSRHEEDGKRLFAPEQAVRNAVQLMSGPLQSAGIELRLDLPESRARARGSRTQLEQVMLNLIANARDAVLDAPDPGETPWVRVQVAEDRLQSELRIVVEDSGGGVPEHLWDKLFDPFFTTKPEGRGTGLGLSISSDIMRLFGGGLSGRNGEHGAVFTATLPLATEQPIDPVAAAKARGRVGVAAGKRLLIVEDEPEARRCMAEYLERRGYSVATAENGAEALRQFVMAPADVVVTDQRMPGLKGMELVRELRELVEDLPVVLTTGQVDFADETAEAGKVALVRKPVSLKKLEAALRALVKA